MSDLKAYHACFDTVARERIHLGMVAAPSLKSSAGWMRMVLGAKCPFYVALDCRRIEKIELQVYASNRAARALYRKFGFRHEGRRVSARKLDGKYDDVILMGLFL